MSLMGDEVEECFKIAKVLFENNELLDFFVAGIHSSRH